MLPFFFRHYDPFVDRYVLFDDGSTDTTLSLLAGRPKVEVRQFIRSDTQSFLFSEQTLSNDCWKEINADLKVSRLGYLSRTAK